MRKLDIVVFAMQSDEFSWAYKGPRATPRIVSVSGNAQPDGFWVRVMGTRACAEVNLFEPPRLTLRQARSGEPALAKLIDGLIESRDIFKGSLVGFWRKLAGSSSYDGLAELIKLTYLAVEKNGPPPIPIEEIDDVARLVDSFTTEDNKI